MSLLPSKDKIAGSAARHVGTWISGVVSGAAFLVSIGMSPEQIQAISQSSSTLVSGIVSALIFWGWSLLEKRFR